MNDRTTSEKATVPVRYNLTQSEADMMDKCIEIIQQQNPAFSVNRNTFSRAAVLEYMQRILTEYKD